MHFNLEQILHLFPKLATDTAFKITSPCDPNYNCIAWSTVKDDVFMWPHNPKRDGSYWPENLPRDTSIETFTQLYRQSGYEVCEDWAFEEGFQKVAIYADPETKEVKHAARQQYTGLWTSKLGSANDIQHIDPFTIESKGYGVATVFMKRKNTSFTRNPNINQKHRSKKGKKKKKR